MTVPYQREKKRLFEWRAPGHTNATLTSGLPFYKSVQGEYVHRIRSGTVYIRHTKPSHTAFKLWCGMTGFGDKKGGMIQQPPAGSPLCATCEGRYIGSGQGGSRMICNRIVKFSPRDV